MSKKTLQAKTSQLKQLIRTTTGSGKAAWEAGRIFHGIKSKEEYKAEYTSFASYTRAELGISEQKAYSYIRIYETLNKKDITDLMLVTHLDLLAAIVTDGVLQETLLAAMKSLEKHAISSGTRNDLPYTKEDLLEAVNILELLTDQTGRPPNESKASEILKGAIDAEAKRKERLAKFRDIDQYGDPIDAPAFPKIASFFGREPIDETGLVALFCSMFHLLQEKEFLLLDEPVQFERIVFVRQRFPDAAIECRRTRGRRTIASLKVEFEFSSRNYLRHEHHKSTKTECHLIVCWEDDMPIRTKKGLPSILSLSDVLKRGEIAISN